MSDHGDDHRDRVETVSISTGTSGTDRDGFVTPMSEPASGAATPRAVEPAQPAAAQLPQPTDFAPSAAAQETPRASKIEAPRPPANDTSAETKTVPKSPQADGSAPPTDGRVAIAAPVATGAAAVAVAAIPAPATAVPPGTDKELEPSTGSRTSDTGSERNARGNDIEKGEPDAEKAGDGDLTAAEAAPQDPNIVDWSGPDDPDKGINWKPVKKWTIVATLSCLTFISPLASSMFAPSVPQVLEEFQVTGIYLESFVVSIYILGYAAGPIVIAPLSELYGRTIVYHSTNIFFIIFTVACALSKNMGQLIAFRFLAGIGGSAVLTMGAGTISDLFIQEQRGRAMALWACGPLIGPVAGPVAGGFLAQAKGWRWIFWVIAMAAGFIALMMALVLRETYAPIILERRAKKLRKETGNSSLRSAMDTGLSPGEAFKRGIFRPLKMLAFSPIVALLTLYNSVVYGYLYIVFTTITEVFEEGYHFSQGVVGLTFLGIGVGMFLGLIIFGGLSDWLLKRRAKKGEMKPEYRLPPMVVVSVFIPIGMFIYGWTADKLVFWFWPIFGTGWLGLGLLGVFMCIQTYLVDAFTLYAASAIAANTIFRSLVGALLPLAGPSLYQNLGLGWGNSLLGFIAVVMIPIPYLFYKYGERIRKDPRFQPNW